jgi:hypothetical protein
MSKTGTTLQGLDEAIKEQIRIYVEDLLAERIRRLRLEVLHAPPKRPREGDIVAADGVDWNPGSGAGTYEYINNSWRILYNSGASGGQDAIQFKDEGTNLGAAGTVNTVNFAGPNIVASRAGNTVTLTQTPQTITLTGDVTGSGTGTFTATIANDAVTFAKMQNISTNTFIGRTTAGTGDPEALTMTTARSMLSINNVENVALSTWTGSTNLSTLSNTGVSAGTYPLGSMFTVNSAGRLTSALSPTISSATLNAGNNNDLTLNSNTILMTLTGSSGSTLTGISSTNRVNGSRLILANLGANKITLAHNNTNSSVGNRLFLAGQVNYSLDVGTYIEFILDTSNGFWREINHTGVLVSNGNATRTGLGFAEDPSTGFYKVGLSNTIKVMCGGNEIASFSSGFYSDAYFSVPIASVITSDPSNLYNGMLWYNNATHNFRGRVNGNTFNFLMSSDISDVVRCLNRNSANNGPNNTTAETTVYSYAIDGPTQMRGRTVRITLHYEHFNNTGVDRTYRLRVKFGGTTMYDYTATVPTESIVRCGVVELFLTDNSSNTQTLRGFWIQAVGAKTATVGYGPVDESNHVTALRGVNASIDTTSAGTDNIEITCTLSAASTNLYFRNIQTILELLP